MGSENILAEASLKEWIKRGDPIGFSSIIAKMENEEDWVLPQETISSLMGGITNKITGSASTEKQLDNIIYMLGRASASQALRILSSANRQDSQFIERISNHAYTNCVNNSWNEGESRVLLDRLLLVLRGRCFGLIFCKKRRQSVMKILRGEKIK